MTAPLYLNGNDNIVYAGEDHYYYQKISPGVTITTSWQKFHSAPAIEKAGYYKVRFSCTAGAVTSVKFRHFRASIAKNGTYTPTLAGVLGSINDSDSASTDYSNASMHWCGYLDVGDIIDLWVYRGTGTGNGFIWSFDVSIEPWGSDGQERLLLDSNNNIIKNTANDWYHNVALGNASVSLTGNTWKKLHEFTVNSSGKYQLEGSITVGATDSAYEFFYCRLASNSGSTPANNHGNSLQNDRANGAVAGAWYANAYALGMANLNAGDTVSLWTYLRIGSGTTSPFVWEHQISATPWADL
jgi:hypothetical protein